MFMARLRDIFFLSPSKLCKMLCTLCLQRKVEMQSSCLSEDLWKNTLVKTLKDWCLKYHSNVIVNYLRIWYHEKGNRNVYIRNVNTACVLSSSVHLVTVRLFFPHPQLPTDSEKASR